MCSLLGNLSATTIEVLLLCVVLLGLISNLYGLREIDWGITYEKYHVFFSISLSFLTITFFYCLLLLYVRFKNTINTIWNTAVRYLNYFFSFINASGLLITLISFINTLKVIFPPDELIRTPNDKLFLKQQQYYIYISMGLVSVFYVLQFPLWYAALKRIKLKTNGTTKRGDFVIASI